MTAAGEADMPEAFAADAAAQVAAGATEQQMVRVMAQGVSQFASWTTL